MDGSGDDSSAEPAFAPSNDRGYGGSRGSHMSVVDAKEQRLERNRESARQSRLRKKEFLGELQSAASALVKDLTRALEASGASIEVTLAGIQQARLSETLPLASKASRTAEEDALVKRTASFLVDACGPDCPDRRAVRRLRFDMLRRLLLGPATILGVFLAHAALAETNSSAVLPPTTTGAVAMPDSAGVAVASPGCETRSAITAGGITEAPAHVSGGAGAGLLTITSSTLATSSAAAMSAVLASPLAATACANAWWRSLAAGAGLAMDQVDALKEQLRQALLQRGATEDVSALRKAAELLTEAEDALDRQCAAAQRQLEAVAGILSPSQLIILLASPG